VQSWRNASAAPAAPVKPAERMWHAPAIPVSSSSEIQTETNLSKESTQTSITFSAPALSYMEQLLLKRSRMGQATPPAGSPSRLAATGIEPVHQGENDGDDEIEAHEEEAEQLEQRIAWLSNQLDSLRSDPNIATGSKQTFDDIEFTEVGDDEVVEDCSSGGVVCEPDDIAPASSAANASDPSVTFVDLKDDIRESITRAATAQRALAVGPLDLPVAAATDLDASQLDDSIHVSEPADPDEGEASSPVWTDPVPPPLRRGAVSSAEAERQRKEKLAAVERELRVSHVSPFRKKSAPLPVPGQDQLLHRLSTEPSEVSFELLVLLGFKIISNMQAHFASSSATPRRHPISDETTPAADTPATVKAVPSSSGPRVHETQRATLLALSMSMMTDFEDMEKQCMP
jgi:hypothetical protein